MTVNQCLVVRCVCGWTLEGEVKSTWVGYAALEVAVWCTALYCHFECYDVGSANI